MSTRVLQVDVTGRPVGFISWMRAVTLVWQERATVMYSDDDSIIKSPSFEMARPLIIQTNEFVKLRPLRENQIVRRVLFARDMYTCQYCGKKVTYSTGTIDHVKPKAKFVAEGRPASDAHTWDNVVLACAKCNTKKGSRLPRECGMMPMKAPKRPDYVVTVWGGKAYHDIQAEYVADYYRIDPSTLTSKRIDK